MINFFNIFKKKPTHKRKYNNGDRVVILTNLSVDTLIKLGKNSDSLWPVIKGSTATVIDYKDGKYFLVDYSVCRYNQLKNGKRLPSVLGTLLSFREDELNFATVDTQRDYKLQQLLG